MKEFERRNHSGFKDKTSASKAWSILHSLETDLQYYMDETNSKNIVPPKHALDMMLKHVLRELYDTKQYLREITDKE